MHALTKMFARLIVPLIVLIAGLALVFVLRLFMSNRTLHPVGQKILPYALRESLLTDAERSFFGVLEEVAGQAQCYLLTRVPLSSLVYIEKGAESFQSYQSTIDRRTLDFVLVTRGTLTPALAIELDDDSLQQEDRLERDGLVDRVLSRARLSLLHVRVEEAYDAQVLADEVNAAIRRGEAG